MNSLFLRTSIGAIALTVTTALHAVPTAYSDYSTFLGDITTGPLILDFDSLLADTVIGDGDTVEGVTFNYPFEADFGVSLMVTDDNDTTSGPHSLGTNDGELLQSGDDFVMDFGATNAIGMYFITDAVPDSEIFAGEITVSPGGFTAALDLLAPDPDYTGTGAAYFIGIIDDTGTFDSATVSSACCGFFLFNVDDITRAAQAPEPASLALLATGLVLVGARRRA